MNCLANYSSYLIPRFYPLQFARFNRVAEKVPEKVPGGFGAARSGSTGFWEVFVQSQVQQGSGKGSGDGRLWCSQFRVNRVPEKVPEKVWDLVRSQVRFKRLPKKVPEKVWEALVQSQDNF